MACGMTKIKRQFLCYLFESADNFFAKFNKVWGALLQGEGGGKISKIFRIVDLYLALKLRRMSFFHILEEVLPLLSPGSETNPSFKSELSPFFSFSNPKIYSHQVLQK